MGADVSKQTSKIRVLVYSQRSLECLFAACAHAGAMNKHTHVETRTYDGTPAYNYLAYYIPALRVEYKEVVRDDEVLTKIIATTRAKLYAEFQTGFARAVEKGPAQAEAYIETLNFFRDASLTQVRTMYERVAASNSALDREMKSSIATWAAVQAVSTVGLATVGAIVGVTGTLAAGLFTGGVYLAVKTLDAFETSGASVTNVAAVTIWNQDTGQFGDVSQEIFNRLAGIVADSNFNKYIAPIVTKLVSENKALMKEINFMGRVYETYRASHMLGGVREVEKKLAQKMTQVSANEAAKRSLQAGTAVSSAAAVRAGARFGLPVVWVANDTFNAWVKYRDIIANQ